MLKLFISENKSFHALKLVLKICENSSVEGIDLSEIETNP